MFPIYERVYVRIRKNETYIGLLSDKSRYISKFSIYVRGHVTIRKTKLIFKLFYSKTGIP